MLPSRGSLKAVIFPGLMSITHRPTVVDDVSADMGRTKKRLRRVFTDYLTTGQPPRPEQAPWALCHRPPEAEEYCSAPCTTTASLTAYALPSPWQTSTWPRPRRRRPRADGVLRGGDASFLPEEQRLKKGDILASMGDLTAARATYQEVMEVFERRVSTLPSLPHRPDSAALEPTRPLP